MIFKWNLVLKTYFIEDQFLPSGKPFGGCLGPKKQFYVKHKIVFLLFIEDII